MYLIVGLGNPGSKYARTHHNAGFDVLELLADRLHAPMTRLKCKALLAETRIGDQRVVLAQPQTFMNLSGESVVELMNWYKVEPDHLIVCYDDIDLDLSALRVRAKGSAGTHNGMRSIIYLLGRDDFPRVRVGIGKPPAGWDLADYVLSGYRTPKERQMAFDGYQDAADVIVELVKHGVEAANRLASERSAVRYPRPEKPKQKEKAPENGFGIIARHIGERIRANQLNCASACVTINGKTAWQGVLGLANIEENVRLKRDSLFRLASMTKPVTAVAFMIQAERGRLSLDAPVEETLPELAGWRVRGQGPARRSVTARDLLTHSSGLAQEEAGNAAHELLMKGIPPEEATLETIVRAYAKLELDFEPGTRTGYSAIAGFNVLARMVEVSSGMPYQDFVRLAIFEPLNMRNTTWFPTPEQWERTAALYAAGADALRFDDPGRIIFPGFPANYAAGGAGLVGDLGDYVKFAQMLLNEGELNGARILESDSVREMTRPQLSESVENQSVKEHWGLGMRVIVAEQSAAQPMPKGCFGWSGAFGTHFWVDPSNRLTAVYMSNMTTAGGSGAETAREFERDVYSVLAAESAK